MTLDRAGSRGSPCAFHWGLEAGVTVTHRSRPRKRALASCPHVPASRAHGTRGHGVTLRPSYFRGLPAQHPGTRQPGAAPGPRCTGRGPGGSGEKALWLRTQHRPPKARCSRGVGERRGASLPTSPPAARDGTHGTALPSRPFAQRGSRSAGRPWTPVGRHSPGCRASPRETQPSGRGHVPRGDPGVTSSEQQPLEASEGNRMYPPQGCTYRETPAPFPGQVARTGRGSGTLANASTARGGGQGGHAAVHRPRRGSHHRPAPPRRGSVRHEARWQQPQPLGA